MHKPRPYFLTFIMLFFMLTTCIHHTSNGETFFKTQKQQSSYQTLCLKNARILFRNGTTFVDTRPEEEWRIGRIASAIHLEINNIEALNRPLTQDIPLKRQPIVVYGTHPQHSRTLKGADFLKNRGYTRIYILDATFSEWAKHDYPVE